MIQALQGVNPLSPESKDVIRWGGNLAPLTLTGEPWRLLASMFLHIGLLHLAANSYMLVVLGRIVEREFGSVRFALIYLLSGLFGSLASVRFSTGIHISAGASGALMGIAGACLAHAAIAFWRDEESDSVRLTGPLIQTIVLNLVLGASMSGIDNVCHIGGLLAGAVIGLAFAVTRFDNNVLKRSGAAAVVSVALLALLYCSVRQPPSPELLLIKRDLLRELDGKPPTDDAAAPDEAL
ncbi:MAG: rhomboid family intramembrane serine protease [Bdellovibrionales bacterium]|nr:rhomboid family intramembrane serine protease [Massilia sp.]